MLTSVHRSRVRLVLILLACIPGVWIGIGAESQTDLPGPRGGGVVRLPNQWWLRPVGRQVPMGDFPVHIRVHPSGKYAAVLHCGYGQHEVVTVELPSGRTIARAALDEAFYGLTFSQDGQRLFCSGAGKEVVWQFSFKDGYLSDRQALRLRPQKERGIAAGIALDGEGRTLYAANLWAHTVSVVPLDGGAVRQISLGTNSAVKVVENAPPVRSEDEDAITKRAEALLEKTQSSDPFPYACVADAARGRLYVSLWAQSAVAVIDLKTEKVVGRWATEEHPNEMLLAGSGKHLYVANANRNTVTVLDVESGRAVETLVAEMQPKSPPGSTPNSLALSPDGKTLFVANANINAVAVFDVSHPGKSRSMGLIPVGWYPTSVRVTPDGKQLLVANGKGLASKANRQGPQPGKDYPATVREYIAGLFDGTLGIIDLPAPERFEEQMKRHTARALQCMPNMTENGLPASEGDLAGNPIPRKLGEASPIRYVLYVIKENRTYDQIFGDMPEGNGDPGLCLFGEKITPNHHKLAREYVLLDNFYVESEVSADGHEWTVGAYATDFVEKIWPMKYGHDGDKKYVYPAEGNLAVAIPAGGYLWDRAKEAGVTYRSYGEFVDNAPKPDQPGKAKVASLEGHFDPLYRSFDMDYPDMKRADRYIEELREFEQKGEMPRLQIIRLPNDHTSGTSVGKPTPIAAVADNDLALGRIVEAVSKSKFWPQTAIFVVEDDAQNGPDHVDAHRTVALVISPYAKRRVVDSTLYSTTSMLRTMELILGLQPMSQFDAAATPMYRSFQATADARPYTALPANVDLGELNRKTAWGADLSKEMDFAKEDAADDLLLNEVVWRSVRGADSPMPAPRRAAFVLAQAEEEDEDEDEDGDDR